MATRLIQETTMSTPAARGFSRKWFRPGKVSAITSKHKVSAGRPIGSLCASVASMNVTTEIAGSSNAAASAVTDCGAL